MPHFSNYRFYDEIGMFIQILQSYAMVATNEKASTYNWGLELKIQDQLTTWIQNLISDGMGNMA